MRRLIVACGLMFAFTTGLTACSSDVVIREPAPEPNVVDGSKVSLKSLWSKGLSADRDLSSGVFQPALVGSIVYAAGNEGEVIAVDTKTGQEIWSVNLDAQLSAGVAASGLGVVVVARSGDVITLDANGQEKWRTTLGKEVIQAPLIQDETVFVQTTNSNVIALDMTSGAILWQYRARSSALTLRGTSQPVMYKNRLLVALDSGAVVALNTRTGELFWERKLQVPKGSNEFERIVDLDGRMTLQDNVLFVPGYQGFLTAIEAYTGQILWQKEISSFMQPAYSVGRVYVADSDSHLLMLDSRTGEVKWQSETFQYRKLTGPKAFGLQVLASDMQGNLYVIDKSTADVLAKRKLGKAPVALVTTPTMVIAQTANGKLRALTLKEK